MVLKTNSNKLLCFYMLFFNVLIELNFNHLTVINLAFWGCRHYSLESHFLVTD